MRPPIGLLSNEVAAEFIIELFCHPDGEGSHEELRTVIRQSFVELLV